MQAVMETAFDAAYLVTVITIGILMIRAAGEGTSSGSSESWRWCWARETPSI